MQDYNNFRYHLLSCLLTIVTTRLRATNINSIVCVFTPFRLHMDSILSMLMNYTVS